MFNFDEANRKSKEVVDVALKNYSEVARGFQAIAAQTAEYSKTSLQDATSHIEALSAVRTPQAALELQTSFMKQSYEKFVAEASRMGELYTDLAKIAYKPYEGAAEKTALAIESAATKVNEEVNKAADSFAA